ncbi:MFS general substrate transporter [Polychaeton citri CBS 116435]|uniref:MFS general substrate transporter n=1 Tax=Polychaeton citri CBS 116435 TaxID=1314669 RepID=A0A9P4UP22_9PEZI|nr:MFS general substrate transporter [Polychaeton citri CBS 116435]
MASPTPSRKLSTIGYTEKEAHEQSDDDQDSDKNSDQSTGYLPTCSTSTKHGQPPNGGLLAWLQVLASFLLCFNSWGTINSFGTFQTYYETEILSALSHSDISLIGSVQSFLLLAVGFLIGPLYDKGYAYHLVVTGSILAVFSQMMVSLCTKYWQVFLAQGLGLGIGAGCLFVPAIAILSAHFSTRLALATGIAASGGGAGGIMYPILLRQAQMHVGFAWAVRINGFVMVGTLLIACCFYRFESVARKVRKLFDCSAFKEPPYTLLAAGVSIGVAGVYVPYYYVQDFAISDGLVNKELGFYLLSVMNASGVVGRLLLNSLADRYMPLAVLAITITTTCILGFCFMAISNLEGVLVLTILYGFFSGAFISLPPSAIMEMTEDITMIGTRLGQLYGVASAGMLLGTPISGLILSTVASFSTRLSEVAVNTTDQSPHLSLTNEPPLCLRADHTWALFQPEADVLHSAVKHGKAV